MVVIVVLTCITFLVVLFIYIKKSANKASLKSTVSTSYAKQNNATVVQAFKHYNKGNYDQAISILDEILLIENNGNKHAYDLRAMCLEIMDFNLDAIDDYTASLKHEPVLLFIDTH